MKRWKMWATWATVAVAAWVGSAVVSWFVESRTLGFGSLVAFAVAFGYVGRRVIVRSGPTKEPKDPNGAGAANSGDTSHVAGSVFLALALSLVTPWGMSATTKTDGDTRLRAVVSEAVAKSTTWGALNTRNDNSLTWADMSGPPTSSVPCVDDVVHLSSGYGELFEGGDDNGERGLCSVRGGHHYLPYTAARACVYAHDVCVHLLALRGLYTEMGLCEGRPEALRRVGSSRDRKTPGAFR